MPSSAMNLQTGLSPTNKRLESLKVPNRDHSKEELEYEKNYRYPDFGFEDKLNFGRAENKQTIWQMLVDHVSG